MDDAPTVASSLIELQQAGIDQGKAIARGDELAAGQYHRHGLLVIDRILTMTGQQRPARVPRLVSE